MTPTEQDKELREQELSMALLELVQEGVKYGYNNNSNGLYHELTESQCRYANEAIGGVMQLITAHTNKQIAAVLDRLTAEMNRYTAGHDAPMRDEALDAIQAERDKLKEKV